MKKNLFRWAITTFCLSTMLLISSIVQSQTVNNWRGPARDGKYPDTNLLKEWPANGPDMLWSVDGLGKGFTSAAIANGKIYTSGLEEETGYIYVISMQGKMLQKIAYGKEAIDPSRYPGARSTPTIADNSLYILSGLGKLVCIDLKAGKEKWSKDLTTDFDGLNIQWFFTENLMIDGNVIYVTPGGKVNNMIALDRNNGKLIWSCAGVGDKSAYCSPLLIKHNGRKMLVTMMAKNIIAVDCKTGELLWSYPYANKLSIHPNTPLYYKNGIYVASGYAEGALKLNLSEDGKSVTLAWVSKLVDSQLGGAVVVDGYVYASGDRNRKWFCVDWETGEIKLESKDFDKGNIIFADGMLYIYTEKGELVLLEPTPGSFRLVSKTMITLGTEQHWAHTVINKGVLYVRHGNTLIAYNIKKK